MKFCLIGIHEWKDNGQGFALFDDIFFGRQAKIPALSKRCKNCSLSQFLLRNKLLSRKGKIIRKSFKWYKSKYPLTPSLKDGSKPTLYASNTVWK